MSKMQTAGIAIDHWKLSTFKRVLTKAGYAFTEHPGLTAGTLLLKVQTDDPFALKAVVEKATKECKA